jgi:hypothetical protein
MVNGGGSRQFGWWWFSFAAVSLCGGGGFRLLQFFVWWWWLFWMRVFNLGFVQADGGVVDIVGFGWIWCDGVLAGSGFGFG